MSGLIDKISVLGSDFTIKTEFICGEEAKILTLVYDGGHMVISREIRSGSTIEIGGETDAAVRLQHMRITETLTERAADLEAAKTSSPLSSPTPPPMAAIPQPALEKTTRPTVEPGSHLETAIAVRQTIGPFGIAFTHHPAPTTAAGFEQALESVDGALDAILKAPTYDSIRLDEQLTLIALKSKVEAWRLADKDVAIATEIWPAVTRFARHLQNVNHRRNLVGFDHEMVIWAMSELGKGKITGEMIEGLRGLGGRDAELDVFLQNPDATDVLELREILLRLMD
jgi:hypothetical protein